MSKEWGILYHIGGRLNNDKGWSETESDNPPDKFWEVKLKIISQTDLEHTPILTEQHMLDNTKMV